MQILQNGCSPRSELLLGRAGVLLELLLTLVTQVRSHRQVQSRQIHSSICIHIVIWSCIHLSYPLAYHFTSATAP
jgi:hypothetical protein